MTPAHWIASGFGIGRFPFGPGTAASLAAVPVGAVAMACGPFVLALLSLVTLVLGVWAVRRINENDDPGWIVVDEFAGQWVAMLGLNAISWQGLLGAFVLFRLFDIAKPGPVGWADRRHDAIGIMADDVIAGGLAAVILLATTWAFGVPPG